jgi:regulatory protein YycI of two-component signal transduction system YycFG
LGSSYYAEGAREKSEKRHADALRNFEFARKVVMEFVWKGFTYQFHDYDQITGIVSYDPTYIGFYGVHKSRRYGIPLSFHQPFTDFNQSLMSLMKNLESDSYVEKKCVDRGYLKTQGSIRSLSEYQMSFNEL